MSDTESFLYRYSWDKEDLQQYPWSHHYVKQPEVLKYLEHMVERRGLRPYMQFNTELMSAKWDPEGHWIVETSTGETSIARYLVTALGLLSKIIYPDIPGLDTFEGRLIHTAAWPKGLDLKGKRVGIIGSGLTGVQVITEISKDVKELVCLQRTPQYTVPSGDRPVAPEYRKWVNENYDNIMAQVRESTVGFGFEESTRPTASVSEHERDEIFESLWQLGNGFRFLMGGFGDISTNREANEAACNFIKKKIKHIVKDPEKARRLMPTELYARRPLCDGGYYEQFNREHVQIVNLRENPIKSMTKNVVQMHNGEAFDLDILILATGFDAVDGNYNRLCIQGTNGQLLKHHWTAGPTAYLGCTAAGFPNMYMITGPQGPFCNIPPAIERHVELISTAIAHSEEARRKGGKGVVEATEEAEKKWNEECDKAVEGSLFRESGSWIFGRNIEGKSIATRFYFGGLKKFRDKAKECVEGGWKGFVVV
jgi:cyclohexanone monooxygenase